MKTWVVTGGAATGKSAFCQILLTLEPAARFVSSDKFVHELLATPEIARTLAGEFGPGILDPSGAVDRAALRALAFADETARLRLEMILHPMVFRHLEKQRAAAAGEGVQLFIAEIPLFYEAAHAFPADRVILVAAADATQRQRLMETRGLDAATADRILGAQLPLSRKLELASTVVWNEGSPELLQSQAQLLLQQIES